MVGKGKVGKGKVGKGKAGIWSFFILGWLFIFLYDSIFDTEFLYVCSFLLFSSLCFFFTIPSRSICLSAYPAGYLSLFLALFLSLGMSVSVVWFFLL